MICLSSRLKVLKEYPAPRACELRGCGVMKENCQDEIRQIWCEVLRVTQVEEEVDYMALGFHSVFMLQILSKINECFGTSVTIPEFAQHQSIKSLAKLVDDRLRIHKQKV